MQSPIRPFYLHIYIWPWPILMVKVKVTYIWTVNISKLLTDRANITIAINYDVEYALSISIFKFDIDLF